MAKAILAAKVNAVFDYDGQPVFVHAGSTVREGHPMLAGHGDLFGPAVPDFDYDEPPPVREQPVREQPAPAKPAPAKAQNPGS